MGTRISLRELIGTFGHTFGSVDIACAALPENGDWCSGFTVVRLSYEEPSAAQARLRDLEARYAQIHGDQFRILRGVVPFSRWDEIGRDLRDGSLRVGSHAIRLRSPIELESLEGELRVDHWSLRPFDSNQWPGLYNTIGAQDNSLAEDSIRRELGKLGYSNAHEAINDLCEVNVAHGQNPGQYFNLSAPVFACIAGVRFLPFENRLDVVIRHHSAITDLKVAVFLREGDFNVRESSRLRLELKRFERVGQVGDLLTEIASTEITGVGKETYLDVRLVHPSIGEVQHVSNPAQRFIPPVERNLLLEAVKVFCPVEKLQENLVRPDTIKSKKLKESAAFELYVSWLLGLCGLSTVLLGEYEGLRAAGSKVLRGSVDILAAKAASNLLFLIACTIGPPKGEDFSNLLHMRAVLDREVFFEASVQILPVVFTGARGTPTYREIEDGLGFIPIVNSDGIETVIALLLQGQEIRFFEFLRDPQLCQLRRPG